MSSCDTRPSLPNHRRKETSVCLRMHVFVYVCPWCLLMEHMMALMSPSRRGAESASRESGRFRVPGSACHHRGGGNPGTVHSLHCWPAAGWCVKMVALPRHATCVIAAAAADADDDASSVQKRLSLNLCRTWTCWRNSVCSLVSPTAKCSPIWCAPSAALFPGVSRDV